LNTPLITIGITCHSEGDWLRECWESVLVQTDDRWEAVLVMDGTSHERTREVFSQLQHPKLRKCAMPSNMGPYPTRNKAFEMTNTPYHFYLDGDDQLPADAVSKILKTFEESPEAGFAYGDIQYFGAVDSVRQCPAEYSANDFVEGWHPPGSCAYRKSLWEMLGGFTDKLARGSADYDFHIGALEAGIRGRHCGGVYYRCRKGHTSVSKSHGPNRHEKHEIMVRRHPVFFSDPRRRRRFLALGYKRAAYANHVAGHLRKASQLSRLALKHGLVNDPKLWVMAVRRTQRSEVGDQRSEARCEN